MHQIVKCICGITIFNCRCIGPKQTVIKKPCTHKKQSDTNLSGVVGEILDAITDIFT